MPKRKYEECMDGIERTRIWIPVMLSKEQLTDLETKVSKLKKEKEERGEDITGVTVNSVLSTLLEYSVESMEISKI